MTRTPTLNMPSRTWGILCSSWVGRVLCGQTRLEEASDTVNAEWFGGGKRKHMISVRGNIAERARRAHSARKTKI